MQPGATPRTTAPGVGDDDRKAVLPLPEYHSQEDRPAIRHAAPDAGANGRRGPESSPVGSHQSNAYARSGESEASVEASAGRSEPAGGVSGRMSIRQPVSFAASRAFCPSRPMASESW